MRLHNKKKILNFLKEKEVITSSELAQYLQVSWNTAEKYLMQLIIDGEIKKFEKKGVNIWILK